jgi:hypothetical protein
MIAWREKFRAFAWHFLVTLTLAIAAAVIIFWVWYPDPFQSMLGGTKFFLLVTGCDLALGPLISLVIYNSKKSRRELVMDYSIVGVVQLAAFVYGVMSMAGARPIYVAFAVDRFDVVLANELADEDLQNAQDAYRTRPKLGPLLIGAKLPTDIEERNNLVFSALEGKDVQRFPRYYVPYEACVEDIKKRAQPLADLERRHPEARQLIAEEKLDLPVERLRWLPIGSPKGFWTVLLDIETGRPLTYIPVDPY